jgi:hypothetical protein
MKEPWLTILLVGAAIALYELFTKASTNAVVQQAAAATAAGTSVPTTTIPGFNLAQSQQLFSQGINQAIQQIPLVNADTPTYNPNSLDITTGTGSSTYSFSY